MVEKKYRIMIAASGTGGHMLPAVYAAQAFQKLHPGAEVTFIGSGRPLEEKIIEGNGYPRRVVNTVGLARRGIKGLVEFLVQLPRAVFQTWTYLTELKPDVVVGFGGYVSVFPLLLAKIRGIPTWLHEPELHPGLANKFLSRFVSGITVSTNEVPLSAKKRVVTGHPVRASFVTRNWKKEVTMPKKILILGGSQGARAVDEACATLIPFFCEHQCELFHQSRPEQVAPLTDRYKEAGLTAQVVTFIEDIDQWYEWSDIIVGRSGAGTTREILITGRPAVLIPLPGAGEQRENALTVVKRGQGFLVDEGDDLHSRLKAAIAHCLDPKEYQQLQRSGEPTPFADAAERIAKAWVGGF